MVVSILDSSELRCLSPLCIITDRQLKLYTSIPDFWEKLNTYQRGSDMFPTQSLPSLVLTCHTTLRSEWNKSFTNQNLDPMRVCTFAYVILVPFTLSIILSTSQLNQTNLPEHQALDFCRGGCRAIVDSSSSHFTVPSEVREGRNSIGKPPTSRKCWKQVKPGNPSIKQRYCTCWTSFLCCKWTHAKRQGRLKLFGKKLLNPPYPSLSGNLRQPSPFKNYVRSPQCCPQCSPLPNNGHTIGSRSAAHLATVAACHQHMGSKFVKRIVLKFKGRTKRFGLRKGVWHRWNQISTASLQKSWEAGVAYDAEKVGGDSSQRMAFRALWLQITMFGDVWGLFELQVGKWWWIRCWLGAATAWWPLPGFGTELEDKCITSWNCSF